MHAPPPDPDSKPQLEPEPEPEPRLDLPDPRAEALLDAALAPAAMDTGLRQQLLALAPAGEPHAAAAPPAIAGRIGFGRTGGFFAGLGLAAAVAAVAAVAITVGDADPAGPSAGEASVAVMAPDDAGKGPSLAVSERALEGATEGATEGASQAAQTLAAGGSELADSPAGSPAFADWPEHPDLIALAEAASASGLTENGVLEAAEPGSAAHRLAELEAAADDPWARSAWASVEADALFADGPSSHSLF